jgi:DNA-binding PadR family transcriptional regulator
MDGLLKLAVLQQLSQKALSGYALMQAIREDSGWRPSPGSLYPLLASLTSDGSATVKASGRKRIYTITKHGLSALEELRGQSRARFERAASQLRVCSPDHRADKDMSTILERLSKGEAPFGWLTQDMLELRRLVLASGAQHLSEPKKRDIRRAMNSLLETLRRAA